MAIFLMTTLDRVKRLPQKVQADHDPLLTSLIEEVSVQIRKFLDREIRLEPRTQFYDVEKGQQEIQLNAYPFDLTDPFTIHNDTAREYGSLTLIDDEDVIKYGGTGIVKFEGRLLSCGPQAIKVTYTGGIAKNTSKLIIHEDFAALSLACEMQVVYIYQRRRAFGSTSHSGAGGSVSNEPGVELLSGVKQLLWPFKNMSMLDGPASG